MKCPNCGSATYTSIGGLEICPHCGYGSPHVAAETVRAREARHIPDLSPSRRLGRDACGIEVLNVGWLDPYHPYSTAEADRELLKAIRMRLDQIEIVDLTLGYHVCEFCHNEEENGEYHFYNPATGRGYAAPAMFYHYMECHNYAPPEEFIQAIFHTKVLDEYIHALNEIEEDYEWRGLITKEEHDAKRQDILSH